jgi:hypothetical protein
MTNRRLMCALAATLLLTGTSWAQEAVTDTAGVAADSALAESPPAVTVVPATDVQAKDAPNDNGHALLVTWIPSADDRAGGPVLGYQLYRATSPDGPWAMRTAVPARGPDDIATMSQRDAGSGDKKSQDYFPIGQTYYYKVRTLIKDGFVDSEVSSPAASSAEIFHLGKLELFIAVVIFTILMVIFIGRAKKGHDLYIRPLAGIDAVDEAIGRATEMGRPILYVLGLGVASDIATIASFTVLGRVAKKVAEYSTKLIVPCYDPIVMTVAQETVRAGYLDAGRPDMYHEDDVYFVTQSQFAYVAAVNGTMMRERPATNFYLGLFYAESLILAETGALAGSIQISGTDQVTQIPFFVVACDYTLIGEELYAASAYLGREPLLMGTLKAQDWAKGVFAVAMLIGIVAALLGWNWLVGWFRLDL